MNHYKINLLLAAMFLFTACEKKVLQPEGYLKGKINIGPICPVERNPPDSACLPTAETFKAYPVGIWSSNGKIKITQLNPSLNGMYLTNLSPGSYLVIIGAGLATSNLGALPYKINIHSIDTTTLDINIDTGIR